MGLGRDILEVITGRVHVYVTVGKVPAVEIIPRGNEIIADIKNPFLAMQMGLKLFMGRGKSNGLLLRQIKSAGYKIKVKYMIFEIEL
jgi:hypothetical protein